MIYTKRFLTGSSNGRGIKVAATATPGTTIHTAISSTTDMEEVWVYAVNTDSVDRLLTLEWGGTTSPDDLIMDTVSAQSGLVLMARLLLRNGLIVRAFAAAADVVIVYGWANRIEAA